MSDFPVDALLLLYRAAREMPGTAFQDYALGLVKPLLNFDTAIWGSGTTDGQSVKVRAAHLHQVDPEAMKVWTQINRKDKVIPISVSRPGTTIQFHAATLFSGRDDAIMREYTSRFGRESYLITTTQEDVPGSVQWVSLFRPDPRAAYSEDERLACETLMPHFSEALRINRTIAENGPALSTAGFESGLALASPLGQIHFAQERFLRAIQMEWSQADGSKLPSQLLDVVESRRSGQFVGRKIRCVVRYSADMLLLEAHAKTALDSLPPKRARIAWLFAAGHSHKDIARKLLVSPSTVRNQIRAAYSDLQISNKAQLLAVARRT